MFRMRQRRRPAPRPKNVRARDGHVRLTSAKRRSICKHGGLTKKQLSRVIKENRAYKKGRSHYRGRLL